jgi:hypothetical protein
MPVHDWAGIADGTFHALHTFWVAGLAGRLNAGLLPAGYEAMPEQVVSDLHPDVLTLHRPAGPRPSADGGLLLADTPPQTRLRIRPDPTRRPQVRRRRTSTIAVRHGAGRRLVAILEIVSPSNKDRGPHVRRLANKIVTCIEAQVNVLLVDILPRRRHDPIGIHGAVWGAYDTVPFLPPPEPLLMTSYIGTAGDPEAFLSPCDVGQPLPPMPLFLTAERYVTVPLELTYTDAFGCLGASFREEIETNGP